MSNVFSKSKLSLSIIFILLSGFFSKLSWAEFTQFEKFGDNPGELTASYYQPELVNGDTVVLLHGCVQNGETLAINSGFLSLAKTHKFNLLVAQQSEKNNIKSCFNWFSKQDTNKNSGELLSLKNIISHYKSVADSKRLYVVGISAGGAMTAALLVNYPELFTAGAIIAGLPFPCADNLTKAISCMRQGPAETPQELANFATKKHPTNTKWPRLSVLTSKIDEVVNPKNSLYLAEQWAFLAKTPKPTQVIHQPSYKLTQWQNEQKQVVIDLIEIDISGHGMTVNPHLKNGGTEGLYLLKSELASAKKIIQLWQLNN